VQARGRLGAGAQDLHGDAEPVRTGVLDALEQAFLRQRVADPVRAALGDTEPPGQLADAELRLAPAELAQQPRGVRHAAQHLRTPAVGNTAAAGRAAAAGWAAAAGIGRMRRRGRAHRPSVGDAACEDRDGLADRAAASTARRTAASSSPAIYVLVDGSHLGIGKPDPRIYLVMTGKLGVEPADVVFLDDQPVNLAGATAVGMTAVAVDVTDPDAAFAQARALLALPGRP